MARNPRNGEEEEDEEEEEESILTMESKRRWEDLQMDCIVCIFRRLGLDDLALAAPFVCKSWYRASLDPACWRVLNFRSLNFMPWGAFPRRCSAQYRLTAFSFSAFLRFAVARSRGSVAELVFPLYGASLQDLVYISIKCPRLKSLALPDNLMVEDEAHIPEIVGRCRELEELDMGSKPSSFRAIVAEIGRNCAGFARLRVCGLINKEDAAAIVDSLGGIKMLELTKSYLTKDELAVILKGCRKLEALAVNECLGFEADDDVLQMAVAAGIKAFDHRGSKLLDDYGYETDESEYQTAFYFGGCSFHV